MGCDIHSWVEVRKEGEWGVVGPIFPLDDFGREWEKRTHTEHPFDWRSCGMFGFLANVRNYSRVPCIQEPVYDLPEDVTEEIKERFTDGEYHSINVIYLKTFLDFNYDHTFWDRRVSKNGNGAALADEGEGETLTIREFLGDRFFEELEIMKTLGGPDDVRVIFGFDN